MTIIEKYLTGQKIEEETKESFGIKSENVTE